MPLRAAGAGDLYPAILLCYFGDLLHVGPAMNIFTGRL